MLLTAQHPFGALPSTRAMRHAARCAANQQRVQRCAPHGRTRVEGTGRLPRTCQAPSASEQQQRITAAHVGGRARLLRTKAVSTSESVTDMDADVKPEPVFDYELAKQLSLFCSIAYCRERTVMRWDDNYCKLLPGAEPVAYVNCSTTDCRAFVAVYPKRRSIVVTFSGSASLQNFQVPEIIVERVTTQTNLQLELVEFEQRCFIGDEPCAVLDNPAKVHSGFYTAAKSLYPEIRDVLLELQPKYPRYQTIVTGHSLGAGTAMLTALMLQEDSLMEDIADPLDPAIYTFAEPMVGNPTFVEYWSTLMATHNQVFRVTHRDDPILHFNEPMWDSLGFSHRAGEVCCSQRENPGEWEVVDETEEEEDEEDFQIPPLDILAHTRYLGTYVGPRLL